MHTCTHAQHTYSAAQNLSWFFTLSIINIVVVIEEIDVVVKWMVITYKEEMKERIKRTIHVKEGKYPSKWWDVQLNRGGCIANSSISYLKEKDWLIRRSTWFFGCILEDASVWWGRMLCCQWHMMGNLFQTKKFTYFRKIMKRVSFEPNTFPLWKNVNTTRIN